MPPAPNDMTRFWSAWSRFWFHIEDRFLDIDVIRKLARTIEEPILIVGGGQGMLIEELRRGGLHADGVELNPNMITYARRRRGIELVAANANDMPFNEGSYRTTIVATGVVDFMDDENAVRSIILEASRVTQSTGSVMVAFHQYHPRVEELLRFADLIASDGNQRFRRILELSMLSCLDPKEFFAALRSDSNLGFFRTALALLKVAVAFPRKEIRFTRRLRRFWKQVGRDVGLPRFLITCVPESVPYRTPTDIQSLFNRLDMTVRSVTIFDGCAVAMLCTDDAFSQK